MTQLLVSVQKDDELWVEGLINKHIELNEGEPIGLFEININKNNAVDICISDWVIEISDYFDEKYGAEKGLAITKYMVGKCLTRGQTLH